MRDDPTSLYLSHFSHHLSYFPQYISHSNLHFKKTTNRILQTKLLRFMHKAPINYLFINYKHHIFNKPSQPFHSSERLCVLQ